MTIEARYDFLLPADAVAAQPPEARGVRRDGVKLLVARPDSITHIRFDGLAGQLTSNDLLVVNTSPTMAAALPARYRHEPALLHVSTRHDDGTWTVELRKPDHSGPIVDAVAGDVVQLGDGIARLLWAADTGQPGAIRLWRAQIDVPDGLRRHMRHAGKPIRYTYVPAEWPLHSYQTVFADRSVWPGSAEMPSAARPFTFGLVASLRTAGIDIASIELHTGVSSQEAGEAPQPERFVVSQATANRVNRARTEGGRIIAVGTTVTRALESAASNDGTLAPAAGWTDLVLGPHRRSNVVSGLITGWHPPRASHLDLLEAVAGRRLVEQAYVAALSNRYLWHEFGDSCLLLPDRTAWQASHRRRLDR